MENQEARISRRQFSKTTAVAISTAISAAEVAACLLNPPKAEAEQQRGTPLLFRQWYPYDVDFASSLNLDTLDSVDGPLAFYDRVYSAATGRRSYARDWAEVFINDQLQKYGSNPGFRTWGGFCHANANMAYHETHPFRQLGEITFGARVERIDWLYGLMLAVHAHDAADHPEGDDDYIYTVLTDDLVYKGEWFVANMPLGLIGRWLGVVYAFNGARFNAIRAGAFQNPTPAQINTFYIPKHFKLKEEVPQDLYSKSTEQFRNPYLDENFVRHLYYGETLPANWQIRVPLF